MDPDLVAWLEADSRRSVEIGQFGSGVWSVTLRDGGREVASASTNSFDGATVSIEAVIGLALYRAGA